MAMKDVPDLMVLLAYCERDKRKRDPTKGIAWPYEILMEWTGQPQKVCYRACERASNRGLLNYGVSLRTGWIEPEGWKLIEAAAAKKE